MAIDQSCCNCGREPSHPQVRYRFVYAAYHCLSSAPVASERSYIAVLCGPCYDADREASSGAARHRFLRQVARWSALPAHREILARLVEYPEGIGGEEWDAGTGFLGGVAVRCDVATATGKE